MATCNYVMRARKQMIIVDFFYIALLNRISHGTDSSRRCDKFDRSFHIRTKVKNTFCRFRVFNPNEFVTHKNFYCLYTSKQIFNESKHFR